MASDGVKLKAQGQVGYLFVVLQFTEALRWQASDFCWLAELEANTWRGASGQEWLAKMGNYI